MVSKKEEIQNKSEALKTMQIGFNQVIDKYKSEATEFNALTTKNICRRALGFYFGEYISEYQTQLFQRKYSIEVSQYFNQAAKGSVHGRWENRNYCNIVYHQQAVAMYNVGFICHKNDVIEALNNSIMFDLWLYFCRERKYKKSMEEFANDLSVKENVDSIPKGKIDLFELISNYSYDACRESNENRNEYFIDIINENKLKLKDIIICIYPRKY